MKKFLLFWAAGILLPLLSFGLSTARGGVTALSVGEKLPVVAFTSVINSKSNRISTGDYKGKYLILDFWASWCTSCLRKFPAADSLQRIYGDRLQILLVNTISTKDDVAKMRAVYARMKKLLPGFSLPSVVGDSVLLKYFPHHALPHTVWLDTSMRVVAITSGEQLTAANVSRFVSGEPLSLAGKKETLSYDMTKPLFVLGNGGDASTILERVSFAGYIEGLPPAAWMQSDKNATATRIIATNQTRVSLFKWAFSVTLRANRIISHLPELSDDRFCYERIMQPVSKTQIKERMQSDLQKFFSATAVKDTVLMPALVVSADRSRIRYASDGTEKKYNLYDELEKEKQLFATPIRILLGWLDDRSLLPVVDETGITLPIDLEFSIPLAPTLDNIKEILTQKGFQFKTENRPVEVFVISYAKPIQ
jgi:thiol-disulfide isomerase/thioredoxin